MARAHKIAAIILAAGRSSRMGESKALIDVSGKPFLSRLIETFRVVDCDPVIVVTGHAPEPVEELVERCSAESVRNGQYELGQLSSVQAGIRALESYNSEGFVLAPVDCPLFDPAPVQEFLGQALKDTSKIAIPSNGKDRRGHPLFVREPLFKEFLSLDPVSGDTARTVLHRDPERINHIISTTSAFFANLNSPSNPEDFLPGR